MALIQSYRRGPIFFSPTNALIIANVIAFILVSIGGDLALALFAQTADLFFEEHFYWQLFTSMFVHFDVIHILANMIGLYYFGRINEGYYTRTQFLAIYFGSGLLGNIASLFLIPSDAISGGASGAIFGLVGSYVAGSYMTFGRNIQHFMAALAYAAFILALSQFSEANVNLFAHLFGLIGGLMLGLALSSKRKSAGYEISYALTV